MAGETLGKASLELEVDLGSFERNLKVAKKSTDSTRDSFDEMIVAAKVAVEAMQRVKMKPGQAAENAAVEARIGASIGRVSRAALDASDRLAEVKLDWKNAAATTASGDQIDRKLKSINRNANETTRSLERTRMAGVGIGPFGSGFGRLGVMSGAIGGGALLAPVAGPATLGMLAAIPVLATTGAGALGTLALAFAGVGKAIGGDKKAFDALGPSAQQFTLTVRSLSGAMDKLQETAGAALFPGLTAGLKAALSPGTMAAITTAVSEFGRAIGAASLQWGRFFGSAQFQEIFGPLMTAGARNLGLMSDTMLRLFDAMGVLGRAAIPFTDWMVRGVDAGARWVDSFVRAKDATGGLAGALNEAKVSLQLVGRLFGSLLNAVYQLGAALYPLSKVVVKGLTDALNSLAG